MSKLTEAETKEIEQLAMEYVSITRPSSFPNGRQEGYIAGATAIAEKKNVEAESRERLLDEYSSALLLLRKKNDATLAELSRVKEELEITKEELGNALS